MGDASDPVMLSDSEGERAGHEPPAVVDPLDYGALAQFLLSCADEVQAEAEGNERAKANRTRPSTSRRIRLQNNPQSNLKLEKILGLLACAPLQAPHGHR
ncbi:hypothetical protein M3Y99_00146600 [Aphelenchoides fujianensis]|nr:hypothetical protein M3Y99_00146600 [Aphelenchoides fujianensis]